MRPSQVRHHGVAGWAGAACVALAVAGCASGSGGGGSSGPANEITLDQIEAFPANNAYEVIQRYKSRWLRPSRNQNTLSGRATVADRVGGTDYDVLPNQETYARVYMDGHYFGDIQSLTQIHPSALQSIEYIDARSATTRYGTGNDGGVIELHSKGLD